MKDREAQTRHTIRLVYKEVSEKCRDNGNESVKKIIERRRQDLKKLDKI